jgi:hypothetical protein
MKQSKNQAKNFYTGLKDDPESIIKWCEEEIEAYQELIKLVKGKNEQP